MALKDEEKEALRSDLELLRAQILHNQDTMAVTSGSILRGGDDELLNHSSADRQLKTKERNQSGNTIKVSQNGVKVSFGDTPVSLPSKIAAT